jgi:hypothetical protein
VLNGRLAVLVLIAISAVGALIDGIAGGPPGIILDLSLVIGTVVAGVLIESSLVWLIIPMPALVFPIMAFAAGIVGVKKATASNTALATDVFRWVSGGFIAMAAATLLAGMVTIVRMAGRRG